MPVTRLHYLICVKWSRYRLKERPQAPRHACGWDKKGPRGVVARSAGAPCNRPKKLMCPRRSLRTVGRGIKARKKNPGRHLLIAESDNYLDRSTTTILTG